MKAAPTYRKRTNSIGDRILNHLECCGQQYLTPRQLFKRLRLKPSRTEEFKEAIATLLEREQIRCGVKQQIPFRWDCALYYNIKES